MKRLKLMLVATGLYLVGMFFTSAVYKSAGSHPGSTGSPKELTCARSSCHDDGVATSGNGINTFKFSNSSNKYKKGNLYDINVRVSKAGLIRSGFEIVALDSMNKMAGTWKITNSTRTQITTVDSLKRFYVTHKVAGTNSSGDAYNEWLFSWTAPANYEGKVTFYYATNVCNSDGKRFGDKIYLSEQSIYGESMISAIKDINPLGFTAFPNPADENISIQLNSINYRVDRLMLIDIFGKVIKETTEVYPDQNSIFNWSLKEIPAGIYFIKLVSDEKESIQKILVN